MGFEPRTSGFGSDPLYQLSHNHCPNEFSFLESLQPQKYDLHLNL